MQTAASYHSRRYARVCRLSRSLEARKIHSLIRNVVKLIQDDPRDYIIRVRTRRL